MTPPRHKLVIHAEKQNRPDIGNPRPHQVSDLHLVDPWRDNADLSLREPCLQDLLKLRPPDLLISKQRNRLVQHPRDGGGRLTV